MPDRHRQTQTDTDRQAGTLTQTDTRTHLNHIFFRLGVFSSSSSSSLLQQVAEPIIDEDAGEDLLEDETPVCGSAAAAHSKCHCGTQTKTDTYARAHAHTSLTHSFLTLVCVCCSLMGLTRRLPSTICSSCTRACAAEAKTMTWTACFSSSR